MNPNLTNPLIVTRMAEERERDLRREMRGMPEAEGASIPAPRRKEPRSVLRSIPLLAWLFS